MIVKLLKACYHEFRMNEVLNSNRKIKVGQTFSNSTLAEKANYYFYLSNNSLDISILVFQRHFLNE